jgi:hypothetical protein
MKKVIWIEWIIALFLLGAPVLLPPIPVYPSALHLLVFVCLIFSFLLAKEAADQWLVLVASTAVPVATGLYFDATNTNIILSWQISGRADVYIALFELAICVPILLLLVYKRLFPSSSVDEGTPHKAPEQMIKTDATQIYTDQNSTSAVRGHLLTLPFAGYSVVLADSNLIARKSRINTLAEISKTLRCGTPQGKYR